MRNQPWFAVVVAVLLAPCALIAAGVFKLVYIVLLASRVGDDPDPFFIRAIFGVEILSKTIQWMAFAAVPNFIQGVLCGLITLFVTAKISSDRNIEIAAYSCGTLYSGFFIVTSAFMFFVTGSLGNDAPLAAIQIVGFWVGLVSYRFSHSSSVQPS